MIMMKNLAPARRLASAAVLVLTAFSACQIQQSPSLLTSQNDSESAITRTLQATPFAYDLAVDTISYNSCVGSGLSNRGIPGFKIGANEGFVDNNGSGAVKGGLKLKSEFLQFVATNIEPNFPNTTVVPSQMQYLLQFSTANAGNYIQYAIRTTSDLKVVPDTIQPSLIPVGGRDGVYENAVLSADPILSGITKEVKFGAGKTVLSEGPRIYNAASSGSPKPFEATLAYNNVVDETFQAEPGVNDGQGAGEEYADRVRSKFISGAQILAVTYGNPLNIDPTGSDSTGLNSPARRVSTDQTKAYGRGYQLNFISKNPALSSWRRNIVSTVTEKNLENGQPVSGVSWTCEHVVIMKPNQFNNKKVSEPSCSQLIAADLTNTNVAARVKNIRRHYPESEWGIGFFYAKDSVYNPATRVAQPLCLVHKQTDCYLPTVGIVAGAPAEDVGVQYDTSQECYLSRFVTMGVTYSGNKTGNDARRLGRCPQFASICVRSSTSY